MKDRRTRLRPKQGARNLYYGGGNALGGSENLFNGDEIGLPWLTGEQDNVAFNPSNPFSEFAPNVPNLITQNITFDDPNLGQQDAKEIADRALEDALNNMDNQIGGIPNANVNILEPLAKTDGMIWPYTPTISYSQGVEYNSYNPMHTNQEFLAYGRTTSPQILVTGNMSVQNTEEAAYALAQIHFLRVISKMSFGQDSMNPGTPPPILLFSAYGDYMFNDLPVILQSFNIEFADDVDYIQIRGTNTYVPSIFNLNVTLVVQNTPSKLRSFNMEKFRSGELLTKKGWI